MEKAQLITLRQEAEQRCNTLYNQSVEINTELERCRGDFRTLDKLVNEFKPEPPEAEIVPGKKKNG
jgi:hypothetical protein